MNDVTDHASRLGHYHRLRFDRTINRPADSYSVAADVPFDLGPFAYGQSRAVDVAFNITVDLDVAIALQVARDLQIRADNRWNSTVSRAALGF